MLYVRPAMPHDLECLAIPWQWAVQSKLQANEPKDVLGAPRLCSCNSGGLVKS